MFVYKLISSEDGYVKISAILDLETEEYTMPSMTVGEDMPDWNSEWYADSEHYLFNTVYKWACDKVQDQKLDDELSSWKEEIKEMFDYGLKIKLLKNTDDGQ